MGRLVEALIEGTSIGMRTRVPQGSRPRLRGVVSDVSDLLGQSVLWFVHGVRDEAENDVPVHLERDRLAPFRGRSYQKGGHDAWLSDVALAEGRHVLEFDVEVGVFEEPGRSGGGDPRFWPSTLYRQRLRLFHEIEVTARGTTSIELVTDPALEAAVRKCITIRGVVADGADKASGEKTTNRIGDRHPWCARPLRNAEQGGAGAAVTRGTRGCAFAEMMLAPRARTGPATEPPRYDVAMQTHRRRPVPYRPRS